MLKILCHMRIVQSWRGGILRFKVGYMDPWPRKSFTPSLGIQFTSPNPEVRRERNFSGLEVKSHLLPTDEERNSISRHQSLDLWQFHTLQNYFETYLAFFK